MTDREIMQQALEALELLTDGYDGTDVGVEIEPIVALRERLAQPEQEPVAWMWDYKQLDGYIITKVIFAKHYKHCTGDLAYVLDGTNATPLYTTQPQRKE